MLRPIDKHNVFDALRAMNKNSRARKLKKCYEILRKEVYPAYNCKAIIKEITRKTGMSKATIERALYGKKAK
jgi:hypothetical protein